MKILLCTTISLISISAIFAQTKVAPKPIVKTATTPTTPVFKNDIDSFSYAVGMSVGKSLKDAGATTINSQIFAKALNDIYGNKKTTFTEEQANITLQQKLQAFQAKKGAAQKNINDKFCNENKKRAGVIALPNGLQYEVITTGQANGAKPKITDTVIVNYVGTLTNGKEFDNSYKRGQPAKFPLTGVIRGWTEILQLMPIGAKWKVVIPSELAYGPNPPSQEIPPNAVLIFEISLEGIAADASKSTEVK